MIRNAKFFYCASLLIAAWSLQVEAAPSRALIGSENLVANGCNTESQPYEVGIPTPENLDKDFNGNLPGIEIIAHHNGNAGWENLAFLPSGTGVKFALHARGAGHYVHTPVGGGTCVGAAGANINVDVYAHYK